MFDLRAGMAEWFYGLTVVEIVAARKAIPPIGAFRPLVACDYAFHFLLVGAPG
jgi:hypothetical protein